MINTGIKPQKIKENIFIAAPSKRCCVLEIFLISFIGFTKKDISTWITSLSEAELKNRVIRLEGKVLEDFKAEYIKSCSFAGEDFLYMLTSEGVRSLFVHYERNNKQNLTKIDQTKIQKLSQKFITLFSTTHNERINHLVFWEEEVKDAINIPDMPNISINNSPGAIVTTGNQNHHLTSKDNTVSNNNVTVNNQTDNHKQKPKWLIILTWLVIIGCLIGIIISIGVKYSETHSWESVQIDWKEGIQIAGIFLGILLKLY